jgi:hypothetical protein
MDARADGNVEDLTHYTTFESQVQHHEYYDFSLDEKNFCALGACIGITTFCLLFFIPRSATGIIIFFVVVGALFCWIRGHPKLRMMSMVHQARGEIYKQAAEAVRKREMNENTTLSRDWTRAEGVYSPSEDLVANTKDDKPNPTKLEMRFAPFCEKRALWHVSGESVDGRFGIMHGLLADASGKIYWVEQHPSPYGQRTILVEGYINYDTFQFMGGTWKDNLGCSGVHVNITRGHSSDAVSV